MLDGISYKISVNELLILEVSHGLTHIQAHGKETPRLELFPMMPQVLQQAAITHELRHNVDGKALGTHTVEPHQLWMPEFPSRAE